MTGTWHDRVVSKNPWLEIMHAPMMARVAALILLAIGLLLTVPLFIEALADPNQDIGPMRWLAPVAWLGLLALVGWSWRRTVLDLSARRVTYLPLGVPWMLARRIPLAELDGLSVVPYMVRARRRDQTIAQERWKVVIAGERGAIDVALHFASEGAAERERVSIARWLGPPFAPASGPSGAGESPSP
jgi:hypothetical protein